MNESKEEVNIDRWIDLNGEEAKKIKQLTMVKKIVTVGLEAKLIVSDKDGYLRRAQNGNPIYAELDGKFVGLRSAAHAMN